MFSPQTAPLPTDVTSQPRTSTAARTGRRYALSIAIAVGSCLLASPQLSAQAAPVIRWETEPFERVGADDQGISGELGHITVPERRDIESNDTIELAFVRWRSTNPEPGAPIVVLAGGPGGSGVEGSLGPATGRMIRLLQYADVIGLDQRGTGLSVPNLSDCPVDGYTLPADEPVTRGALLAAQRDAIERVGAWWSEQGVDLAGYNTRESADDIDDLRRALGVDAISLWGASYGSHLGLAYLRRHGEHVDRAVLAKVEGPDHTLKLPATTQAQLERFSALVAADPTWAELMPDLTGTVRDLLRQLEAEPVRVPLGDDAGTITIGPLALQFEIANTLGFLMRMVNLPASLHAMSQGDFSVLVDGALELRQGGVGSAMAQWMDCASGASRARMSRISKQARDRANLLSDAVNLPWLMSCQACGDVDLGDEFRGTLKSDVPVLFVSGVLDARTPPSNVEELLPDMPNAVHVVVDNVAHGAFENLSPEYRDLLAAYLRGERVQSVELALAALPIQPPLDQ